MDTWDSPTLLQRYLERLTISEREVSIHAAARMGENRRRCMSTHHKRKKSWYTDGRRITAYRASELGSGKWETPFAFRPQNFYSSSHSKDDKHKAQTSLLKKAKAVLLEVKRTVNLNLQSRYSVRYFARTTESAQPPETSLSHIVIESERRAEFGARVCDVAATQAKVAVLVIERTAGAGWSISGCASGAPALASVHGIIIMVAADERPSRRRSALRIPPAI